MAERLVFHGCGLILMMGCPVGIDWTMRHLPDGRVRLSEIRRFDATTEGVSVTFPDLAVEMDEAHYRDPIIALASEVKQFFLTVTKRIEDDVDREDYNKFWQEFDDLFAHFGPH